MGFSVVFLRERPMATLMGAALLFSLCGMGAGLAHFICVTWLYPAGPGAGASLPTSAVCSDSGSRDKIMGLVGKHSGKPRQSVADTECGLPCSSEEETSTQAWGCLLLLHYPQLPMLCGVPDVYLVPTW